MTNREEKLVMPKPIVALFVSVLSLAACGSDDTSNAPAPSTSGDIVDVATQAGSFHTLLAAAQAADLVTTLKSTGPLTVFAPTDAAFAALPAGTVDTLLKPENKAKLADVLTYHVVAGAVTSTEVVKLTSATTVEGKPIMISVVDGKVKINDATVTQADVKASNGVIHVVDKVLLPPM